MDSFSMYSLIALGIACGLLFLFIKWNRRREQQLIVNRLNGLAQAKDDQLVEHDSWINALIGLGAKKHLFFIKGDKGKELSVTINLQDVKACRLIKEYRDVKNKEQDIHLLDRIRLVFTYRQTELPALSLELYNSDCDAMTVSNELEMGEKWFRIVHNLVDANASAIPDPHNNKPTLKPHRKGRKVA